MTREIQYIDTQGKLNELSRRIGDESWIAIDTEFLREKTYYPKFCLLQIATLDWVACIDPLLLSSLEPLFEVIYRSSLLKVFHSCRQDLEIFYHLTGHIPGPIFDTQLAAPLLGFHDNPGYGMLVSSLLNVNLSKAHTRTDWSTRPLHEEQLKYAADDVIYLARVYQKMHRMLVELGRVDWLREDFAALTNPDLYLLAPEKAWLRIKGTQKLTGKQLSVLQALAKWREATAQQENRPRNWLLRDDLLIEIAKLQPSTVDELFKIRSINERSVKRYGAHLCQLIAEAQQRPPIKADDKRPALKLTQQQEAIIDILAALVRIRADENSLNPSVLATRKELEKFLCDQQSSVLAHGWRFSMAGEELRILLQGKALISLQSDKVNIMPHD